MFYEIFRSHLELLVTAILGLLGLLILRFDLKARRDLHQEELKLRQVQYESEQSERQERIALFQRETIRLSEIAAPLGKAISEVLSRDYQWAIEALERAKLGPHAATLFGERSNHFREEKEYLAENFVPLLLQRCQDIILNRGKRVYLLLDSGTTIYPIFTHLGQAAIRCHANHDHWIDKLTLVTNNLPGVSSLMESGRMDPNNRYSPLAIKCELLPGVPLPIYSAVTGAKANAAVQAIRATNAADSIFIAILTGNWIRLPRSQPYPIPLARGDGHPEFKKALIDNSDEAYVVTTLGKIFAKLDLAGVNAALDLDDKYADPDKKPYAEVKIEPEKAACLKLVTTSRPSSGFVLSILSAIVRDHLEADSTPPNRSSFIAAESVDVPHILFPFTKLPQSWYHQIETEFPHPRTRREEFMSTYFSVPSTSQQ